MPASLYTSDAGSTGMANVDFSADTAECDNRAELELALQLAFLQGNMQPAQSEAISNGESSSDHYHANPDLSVGLSGLHLNGGDSDTDDIKSRKSSNTTECVPVPSSEHVAEIVGRQGCKIKALRAKTNTYIKTPVRGNEPVFIVTGRKEDVQAAKLEILSAAEHFTHIRAARRVNINSTLALGQLMQNTPGQTTIQVRVPYKVVGLVVGPKGATIKRIQQQTHTYIVTPSREKEPIFEVTGLPENVDTARREIESHIALRTGQMDYVAGDVDNFCGPPPIIGNMNGVIGGSRYSPSALNIESNGFRFPRDDISNAFDAASTYSNMGNQFRSNNYNNINNDLKYSETRNDPFQVGPFSRPIIGSSLVARSSSGSQDSGIENSSPLDTTIFGALSSTGIGALGFTNCVQLPPSSPVYPAISGIWSTNAPTTSNNGSSAASSLDLNLGSRMTSGFGSNIFPTSDVASERPPFLNIGTRSSLDLGSLGRPLIGNWGGEAEANSNEEVQLVAH